jgi:hypothetical protein
VRNAIAGASVRIVDDHVWFVAYWFVGAMNSAAKKEHRAQVRLHV